MDKFSRKLLRVLPNIIMVLGLLLVLLSVGPTAASELAFRIKTLKKQDYTLTKKTGNEVRDSVFARLLSSRPILLEPSSSEFGIVIERIGVNAPIVADVPITDQKAYREALKDGVAHASISAYPSKQPGNVYLFAHSSFNFWELGKYATVFNLLRKLEAGDTIHVFYKGDDYIYKVVNNEIFKGWDTSPITRKVIEPVLTLQTCDPPGTTLNRLVITAILTDVVLANKSPEKPATPVVSTPTPPVLSTQ